MMGKEYLGINAKSSEERRIISEAGRFNGKANIDDIKQEFMCALKYAPAIYTEEQFMEAKRSNPRGLPSHIFYEVAENGTISLAERMYIKEDGKVSFQE